mmetsp:Transcript_36440/g.78853  ORF Transcript_36440/g.78853 Transcript_36440/m.78853 type:complete len:202 (-) Transcript_36440:189-794(-)
MVFHLARQAAITTARRSSPLLAARTAAPAANVWASRGYLTVVKYQRSDVVEKLETFRAEVFSTNWADYLNLVYNVPFWELEYEKLSSIVQPYIHEEDVGKKFSEVQELMDVMYQCEDVRDHLNELAELCTRASGFMGTGYAAEEKVDNLDEHAKACSEAYDALLAKHPDFKPKIEQTVGHGLAILRQKHKFKFGSMHRYFF